MANYLYTQYFLVENSQLNLNENSTNNEFESVLSELMSSDSYLNIKSRWSHSASLISELLQLSENNSDLWFLTDTLSADDPYRYMIIPCNCYENYLFAIQKIIFWIKSNTDKVSTLIDGGWNEDDVKKAIGDGAAISNSFDIDYHNPDSLFSYLSSVVQMFHYAMNKKMSIVYMSYLL